MTKIAAILMGLGFLSASAAAHEDFRIVGEIAKADAKRIDVKMRDGKVANVNLDGQTTVTRDKTQVDMKELKQGQFVVIDAYGDNFNDLLALSIQLVPPIAPAK